MRSRKRNFPKTYNRSCNPLMVFTVCWEAYVWLELLHKASRVIMVHYKVIAVNDQICLNYYHRSSGKMTCLQDSESPYNSDAIAQGYAICWKKQHRRNLVKQDSTRWSATTYSFLVLLLCSHMTSQIVPQNPLLSLWVSNWLPCMKFWQHFIVDQILLYSVQINVNDTVWYSYLSFLFSPNPNMYL